MRKLIIPILGAIAVLASCSPKEPEVIITDEGPEVNVLSYTDLAYYGTDIQFTFTIQDSKYDLSVLDAQLRYDGEVVASTTIRTKTAGEYSGTLTVPISQSGQEGVAELAFVGQNVTTGKTTIIKEVEIKKPNFGELYLLTDTGDRRVMTSEGDCCYSITDIFPSRFAVSFESPVIPSMGEAIVYGFTNSALKIGGEEKLNISQSFDGECTINVDLLKMEVSYSAASAIAFSADQPEQNLNLVQGAEVSFVGVDDFYIDIDYFEQAGTKYKFTAVSGMYKLVADYSNKFIRIDPVNADGSYITAYDESEGVKAIYAIGAAISKGGVPASAWDPGNGAWPLAQYEKDKYRISFLAGRDVVAGSYFHMYNCKGWTSTFAHTAFSSVDLGPAFVMDMSDAPSASGNIGTASIEMGKGYRLLFDFTEGYDHGKVSIEEVEFPSVGEVVYICGQRAIAIDNNHYCLASASIEKGSAFSIEGIDNVNDLWVDPDYVTGNTFSAMTGFYQVDIYLDKTFVQFHRLKSDGGAFADINTGAIWLMGWGVGMPSMSGPAGDNQPGWDPSKAIAMAEIEPGVYQFSGYAGGETSPKLGDRFRYDYLGLVWYGEAGWNQGNKGYMKGGPNAIKYTDRALEYLADSPADGWQTLSQSLEEGAFYVMTIDLNTPNVELVDFYRKD